MQLHDAVGINCKNGATAENQGLCLKYMGYVVSVGLFCRCDLTCNDYPTLVEGESHGILLYYITKNAQFESRCHKV